MFDQYIDKLFSLFFLSCLTSFLMGIKKENLKSKAEEKERVFPVLSKLPK